MRHFNMCHACGKWVCDLHYNEETMNCVECAPKKMYCYECGKEVLIHEKYCKNCVESCMGKPHPLSDICDVCIYENFEPTYFT